ncbi:MAG: hypothetical protein LBD11_08405 [Candidatus Peribacteria bacterium]|jgi:hypothetical protein|nr:hypothetical protein [Candidatus Peribacteria bacterium]
MESLNLVGLESLLSNPAKKVVEKIGNKILNTTENVAEYATPLLENSYNAVGSTVKSLANTIETSAKNTLQRNLNDFVMKSAGKGLNTLKKTPIDMNKFVDDTIDAVGSIIKNKENLKFIDDI